MVKGKRCREIFEDNLEKLARNEKYIDKFWLEVFNLMSSNGIAIRPFEIDGEKKWREIDFHPDLEETRNLLKLNNSKNPNLMHKLWKNTNH